MQALLQTKGVSYALSLVGDEHKYQIRILGIILAHFIPKIFFIMYYPFLNQTPVFLCTDAQGQEYDCYENNGGCIDQVLSPNSPNSVVTELEFYCENAYVRTLSSVLFFVGGNIGSAYFSYVSDKKGRKTSLFQLYLCGSIGLLLLGAGSIGAFSYTLFLMVVWAGMSCHCAITLTYLAEVSSEKFSRVGTLIALLTVTASELTIVIIAYFVTSWQTVMICFIALPCLAVCTLFAFMDETPVYLYGQKDISGTIRVLKKIGVVNEKPLVDDYIAGEPNSPKTATEPAAPLESVPTKSWNYIEILLHPELRQRVLTFSVVKLYLYMAFYGCLFALASLGGNIYVNTSIAAVAEALGYVLSYRFRSYPVRTLLKRSLQTVVACGLGFLLVPIFGNSEFLQSILALTMRAAVCFVYGFIYNLGNDIFPPEVRSQSVGISEIASVLGGIASPFVILFAETYQINALFLFGTLGFVALVASQYVPSTPMGSLEEYDTNEVEMKYVKMAS